MVIFAVVVGAIYWQIDDSCKSGLQNRYNVQISFFCPCKSLYNKLNHNIIGHKNGNVEITEPLGSIRYRVRLMELATHHLFSIRIWLKTIFILHPLHFVHVGTWLLIGRTKLVLVQILGKLVRLLPSSQADMNSSPINCFIFVYMIKLYTNYFITYNVLCVANFKQQTKEYLF